MATEPILTALDVTIFERHARTRPSVLSDYWALTKPEINFLIAMATLAAFCLGCTETLAHFPWSAIASHVVRNSSGSERRGYTEPTG